VRVRWTTPALRDLEIIGDHIERENSAAVAARSSRRSSITPTISRRSRI